MGTVNIDMGGTVPYFVDLFLSVIGKDATTVELQRWFEEVQRVGLQESSTVMAIGMHSPLPLDEIYQPTNLVWESPYITITLPTGSTRNIEVPGKTISPASFLNLRINSVVFAGPGWGKTTFLHHVFMTTWRDKTAIPVLFTLRRPGGLAGLGRFVDVLHKIRKRNSSAKFLLLVDGYDEVSTAERKQISELLLRYSVSNIGNFILTCRDFYDVYDLKVPEVRIGEFTEVDQEHYVQAFFHAYRTDQDNNSEISAGVLLDDLQNRGLGDFLKHPLLLALVCIVKTGKLHLHSRSVLSLIARAIETLSFRWDEGKGVSREQRLPLDGRDRIACLMRIAFKTHDKHVSNTEALELTEQQLDLLSLDGLEPRQVLMETARFYGILVPTADGGWEFVHKTLQDYLAAKMWVEQGLFRPERVQEWDTRAAYAGCMLSDATSAMKSALGNAASLPAFAEMLSNEAYFNHAVICDELRKHYSSFERHHFFESTSTRISVQLTQDFISISSTKFLLHVVEACTTAARSKVDDALAAYALSELLSRGVKLPTRLYLRAVNIYGFDKFSFRVHRNITGWSNFLLNQLAPS